MKPFILILTTLTLTFGSLTASSQAAPNNEESLHWYVKLEEAQAESKKTDKPIFAFFTGSDWCGWCMKLQANVFRKPAFVAWANENVILLELDYPRRKQLPPELAAQNRELKNFFQPRGFPTIWIFDMSYNEEAKSYQITPFGNLGYPSGSQPGQEEVKFIQTANQILANKDKMQQQQQPAAN
ncbi:thioredoxin family protein [bacterium SCSIO 12741]|nr:thioredoxin family protein [bacterium SCSIO 12741]